MVVLFKRKKKEKTKQTPSNWKITHNCLDLILECAKSNHPNEFAGLLRREEDKVIDELIMLPGTVSGDAHAIFKLHMLPIDMSIVGTIHSHPSESPYPSQADLDLFAKQGKIHIIVAKPFSEQSWKAYYSNGEEAKVEII